MFVNIFLLIYHSLHSGRKDIRYPILTCRKKSAADVFPEFHYLKKYDSAQRIDYHDTMRVAYSWIDTRHYWIYSSCLFEGAKYQPCGALCFHIQTEMSKR